MPHKFFNFYTNKINIIVKINMTTFQTQLLYALGNKIKVLPDLRKIFLRPLIQSKFNL